MNTLPGFEQRLLDELRDVVTERPTEPRRRPSRRLVAAAAAAVVAGAMLAVGVPLLAGDGATPAYAVEASRDGRITIAIHRLDDAAGLERDLAAHGVRARVSYTPSGTTCKDPWWVPSDHGVRVEVKTVVTREGEFASFTFRRSDVGRRTLVIHNSDDGRYAERVRRLNKLLDKYREPSWPTYVPVGKDKSIMVGLSDGPVPPCKVVPF
jgi:hypothetical protein